MRSSGRIAILLDDEVLREDSDTIGRLVTPGRKRYYWTMRYSGRIEILLDDEVLRENSDTIGR